MGLNNVDAAYASPPPSDGLIDGEPDCSHTVPSEDGQHRIAIQFPDLFVSFLAEEPRVSPYYRQAAKDSEAWLAGVCRFTEEQRESVHKVNYNYFGSVMVEGAPPERLRTVCDWGNWVFPFDDAFDNGKLRRAPQEAREEMDRLLVSLRHPASYDFAESRSGLIDAHDSIWLRLMQGSTKGVQRRFVEGMIDYCEGVILQVDRASTSTTPTVEESLDARKRSGATYPLFALTEFALGLELPDEVFQDPAIKRLEEISTEFTLLHNDMLSYPKEQAEGVDHNIIAALRATGLTAQQAFDQAADEINKRLRQWYLAMAEVKSWGESTDRQVQRYIRGVRDVVTANLNWSFVSYRYLGKSKDEARKTRTLYVLP